MFRTKPLAVLAAAAMLLVATPSAFAHAELVSSMPAADATATPAPHELRLTFNEGLELAFSKVVLKGPDGAEIATGPTALDPQDAMVMVVPLEAPLADGAYTVEWTATSADGHKTKGSFTFTSKQ